MRTQRNKLRSSTATAKVPPRRRMPEPSEKRICRGGRAREVRMREQGMRDDVLGKHAAARLMCAGGLVKV